MKRRSFLSAAIGAAAVRGVAQNREWLLFIGTYTRSNSKGIYCWRYDSSGKMTPLGLAAESSNPSFLAIDSRGRFLYTVNENSQGAVSAFAIDRASGKLKAVNSVSTKGAGPCHLSIDRSGKWVAVANYDSGSVAVLPIAANGSLGEASAFVQHSGSSVDPKRQTGPHAHMAAFTPDNRFLLVPDLGIDRVQVYRFDARTGALTANDPAYLKTSPGFGPRHLTFEKGARFVYVLGEMAASAGVFRFDAEHGKGEEIQTVSMLPEGYSGVKSGAEIALDGSGRFLYASNRGHDSIAIFGVDRTTGLLTPQGQTPARVKTPRNFGFDPAGGFLLAAGQDSNSVALFRADNASGRLTAVGEPVEAPVPVSIAFTAAS
jgi:6-phosphogluconolactonase